MLSMSIEERQVVRIGEVTIMWTHDTRRSKIRLHIDAPKTILISRTNEYIKPKEKTTKDLK